MKTIISTVAEINKALNFKSATSINLVLITKNLSQISDAEVLKAICLHPEHTITLSVIELNASDIDVAAKIFDIIRDYPDAIVTGLSDTVVSCINNLRSSLKVKKTTSTKPTTTRQHSANGRRFSSDVKDAARRYYLAGFTPLSIAKKLGTSKQSVCTWVRGLEQGSAFDSLTTIDTSSDLYRKILQAAISSMPLFPGVEQAAARVYWLLSYNPDATLSELAHDLTSMQYYLPHVMLASIYSAVNGKKS